jgi:hypothetical protein
MARRILTVVIAMFVVALGVQTPASAQSNSSTAGSGVPSAKAVPGIAPASVGTDAVYLDPAGRAISNTQASNTPQAEAAAFGCTPESGRDNPHYSSGDVSGHGWWRKGTCTAATATVYNCLYEYYTDNTWRQKACSPSRVLRPYTGSGDRTVARARCANGATVSWRNHVDVDVDGQIDTSEKPYNQANVACTVF